SHFRVEVAEFPSEGRLLVTPITWQKAIGPPGLPRYPAPFLDHLIVPRLPRPSPRSKINDFLGHRAIVGQQRWFYRSETEWNAIAERLKRTASPRCKVPGNLIRTAFLRSP